jgi:ketosteroid isomerase-like protein
MRARLCLTALALCASAATLPVTPAWAMGQVQTEEAERMLSRFILALNANMPPHNDPQAVAGLFTEDAVQSHPFGEPDGGPQRGRKALAEFFAGFDRLFSRWTYMEKSRTVQGGRAVWEGTAEGIHKETGRLLKLPIVFVLMFGRDGKVMESRVYVDTHLVAEPLR